ncbi:hypothetical protein IFR05_017133, partial [Cadophora sp. M221]
LFAFKGDRLTITGLPLHLNLLLMTLVSGPLDWSRNKKIRRKEGEGESGPLNTSSPFDTGPSPVRLNTDGSLEVPNSPQFPTPSPELITTSDPNPARSKSLKRGQSNQVAPSLTSTAHAKLGGSSSPKSPRFKGTFSPGFAPITGEVALVDERRRFEENQRRQQPAMSENSGHKALSSLMAGGGAGMSKPQDAPVATTTLSEGLPLVANAISIPSPMHFETNQETSPASVMSLASLSSSAQVATASSTLVVSPAAMSSAIDAEAREPRPGNSNMLQTPSDGQQPNRALSFPGNILAQQDPRLPSRGLSLPMPGQQLAPRSPSQKKHKCPYCETKFTRHHNLKSHLLTHSQEKPYVCQTWQLRQAGWRR